MQKWSMTSSAYNLMVPGVPTVPETNNVDVASKFERYCIVHQGAILCHEEMDNSLLWWKVCVLAHLFSFYLIYLSRFTHTSFRPLLASLGTILPFQEPLFWLSNYFPSLGIYAQTSTRHRKLQLF